MLSNFEEYFIPQSPSQSFFRLLRMRVLHFLPYYVAGLYCEEKHLNSIRQPRLVGAVGVMLTFTICLLVDPSALGHIYFVPSWELTPHLVFFLQYILCGAEVLSVVLLCRSIVSPIFPYTHANSTLAIYEWHWPIVGMISWGQAPFTSIEMPSISNPSLFVSIVQSSDCTTTLLLAHVLSFAICIFLGSPVFWQIVRHISDPNCDGLFVSLIDDNLNTKPEKENYSDRKRMLKKQVSSDLEKGPPQTYSKP